MLRATPLLLLLSAAHAATCAPGTFYYKDGADGNKCGDATCCDCRAGFFCPGTASGNEAENRCPAGTCSPPLSVSASDCAAPKCASVVCPAGTYFRKYGPACGNDCCECVPGSWCPGTVDGFEKMFPCPAGECSPAGATAEAECAAPACAAPPGAAPVEQVHVSLTGVAGEMHVSFVSNASCAAPVAVAYGGAPGALSRSADAAGALLTSGMDVPICIFSATLTGLAAGSTTYYRIDGDNETRAFANAPQRAGGNVYLVMGDYGTENDVAQAQLVAENAAKMWDAIVYAGDMA